MGASAPLDCPGGTYSAALGQSSVSTCVTCPAGSFCVTGATAPLPCSAGTVSLEGVASCTKCVAGTHQEREGSTGCKHCPAGSYCAEGASTPVPCEGGTFSGESGMWSAQQCYPVTAGFWAPIGSKAPKECFPGFYCPGQRFDVVNDVKGSMPIIVDAAYSTAEVMIGPSAAYNTDHTARCAAASPSQSHSRCSDTRRRASQSTRP